VAVSGVLTNSLIHSRPVDHRWTRDKVCVIPRYPTSGAACSTFKIRTYSSVALVSMPSCGRLATRLGVRSELEKQLDGFVLNVVSS
jgi:hypothetical protein